MSMIKRTDLEARIAFLEINVYEGWQYIPKIQVVLIQFQIIIYSLSLKKCCPVFGPAFRLSSLKQQKMKTPDHLLQQKIFLLWQPAIFKDGED